MTSNQADSTPARGLVLAGARLPLYDCRVLVVDDEEGARDVLRTVLEAEGAVVSTASSAAAALNQLEQMRPDAMLVDISMPVVDGFTLVEQLRLRSAEKGGRVPVAALTGYVSAEDQSRAQRAGFQAYLVKPVDPSELINAVKALAASRICEPAATPREAFHG